MPLSELGERMTGEEFGQHLADYRRQPWGPERDEVHAAMMAATIARFAGRSAKDPDRVTLEDFLVYSKPARAEPDPGAFARQVNAARDIADGAGRG